MKSLKNIDGQNARVGAPGLIDRIGSAIEVIRERLRTWQRYQRNLSEFYRMDDRMLGLTQSSLESSGRYVRGSLPPGR